MNEKLKKELILYLKNNINEILKTCEAEYYFEEKFEDIILEYMLNYIYWCIKNNEPDLNIKEPKLEYTTEGLNYRKK